jgi:phage gpG-like protein
MIDFQIDIDTSKVRMDLRQLDEQMSYRKRMAFLRRTGVRMERSIMQNFENEGRPNKWAPLKPSTIKRRPKGQRARPKILQVTSGAGGLRGSIAQDIDPRAEYVEVGTNKPYSPHLQKGTPKMAARPHIMFQDKDYGRIERDADQSFGVKK